ncbi:MAG: hypothetical protein HYY14_07130 [Candidatus Omnitrophica bacterium]|nr:hypothetical protein [Candidatus Omnitrophota bacterium]
MTVEQKKNKKQIGEILRDRGLINEIQLISALAEQQRTHEFLGQILLKRSIISDSDLAQALSEKFELPYLNLVFDQIDWDVVQKVNPTLAVEKRCLPLFQDEWSLTAATVNPTDAQTLSEFERYAGSRKVRWVVISDRQMDMAFSEFNKRARRRIQEKIKDQN